MDRPLNRIRRHRGLLALVVITWLPFVSVRCIDGVAGGCPNRAAHEHGEIGAHGFGYDHRSAHVQDRGAADGDHDTSHRTCCELTGKLAVEVASWQMSPPLAAIVTRLCPSGLLPGLSANRPMRRVADATHHPPPYLLFATLLI